LLYVAFKPPMRALRPNGPEWIAHGCRTGFEPALKYFQETAVMKLKPLADRVVVEREEAKEKTAGGIVLPDTAKDKPQKGKVIAVGDGRITKDGKKRELQVKVGDHVLFTSYAGDEFKLNGDKKVLLMREDDILAVIEG